MAAALFPIHQFFDNAGAPLNGGLIYTYQAGSTTPKTAYSDADLTIPQTNPIVLDAYGRPATPIWCSGETKLVIKTSVGVQINPVFDNFNKTVSGLGGWSTKNDGVLTKSANYSIVAADDGKVIAATSGSWTLSTAVAAATMGDGFVVDIVNLGSGIITIDPIGAETVNGVATLPLSPNESASLVCDGSNWRLLFKSTGLVHLATNLASVSAALDFTLDTANYDDFVLFIDNLKPATNATGFWLRVSDGTTVIVSGYQWARTNLTTAAANTAAGSASDTKIELLNAVGNLDSQQISGVIYLRSLSALGLRAEFNLSAENGAGTYYRGNGFGIYTPAAYSIIRLAMSSGNITSGTTRLYGVRKL